MDYILDYVRRHYKGDQKRMERLVNNSLAEIKAREFDPYMPMEKTRKITENDITTDWFADNNADKAVFINYEANKKMSAPDLPKIYVSLPDMPPTFKHPKLIELNPNLGNNTVILTMAAFLMVGLVFIIRMSEKCLEKKVRMYVEDWYDSDSNPGAVNEDVNAPTRSTPVKPDSPDFPPPYPKRNKSGNKIFDVKTLKELPPPYAACYVTYSTSKEGVLPVHFVNSRGPKDDKNKDLSGEMDYIRLTRLDIAEDFIDIPDVPRNVNIRHDVYIDMNGISLPKERVI